jgi:TRAP-type C4-dicarboxylate transport system permease small subunit
MTLRQKIDQIMEKFLAALMAILVVDVLWQVISRYVLSAPSSFTDELAGFLLIWVGLFGAAYVAGKKEHLAIDLLVQKSGPARRKFLEILISITIIIFSLTVLVVGGTWLVYTRFALSVKSAALEIPLGYVYIVLPISGLLIVFFTADNLSQFLKAHKDN